MDLISKKELLAQTGISYGQLYRWKREGLIPPDWFIKQSSYTGQETFFPREQMLARIQAIKEAKDHYSLEQLAQMLSPETVNASLPAQSLSQVRELDSVLLALLEGNPGRQDYGFWDLVLLVALSRMRKTLSLGEEELSGLMEKVFSVFGLVSDADMTCTVFLAHGTYHLAFSRDVMPVLFDGEIQAKAVYPLSEIANELKLKYGEHLVIPETKETPVQNS